VVQEEEIARIGSPDSLRCTPVPDWIEHQPYVAHVPETEVSCISNGVCRLLSDIQVDLTGVERGVHSRVVQRVLTREGAERAAHFVAEFDPGYQRLEVHFIRVLRGDERIENAKLETFQIFRRETNLERLTLNGRLTASLVIPDVRVGDIVEIGFTLYGSTPVLGGRYAAWASFDCFNPWFETRHRVLRPLVRKVFVSAYNNPPAPDVTLKGDIEDSRWHLVGQKRREAEELTPPWLVLAPALQFSEFETWNDVACLFSSFYEGDIVPDALAAEIDRLAMAHEDLETRAAEWLRLVQRSLRYFAFSFGEGGLMPRELRTIWSTRFGDCKDAAKLYIAGARRMGLDVSAALVSTTHGIALDGFAPSPDLFNHCIVRLRLNGVSYWLDPTMPAQSGSLRSIFQPHSGWALPLTPEATLLEEIGSDAPLHILHLEEELSFGPKPDSPATLCRHIDHFCWAADFVRNRFANEGTTEYARATLRELQLAWPGIVETMPLAISDDQAANRLRLTLSYEIRDCWKPTDGKRRLSFSTVDAILPGELTSLRTVPRQTAIHLGRPRKITRYMRMNMPCQWAGNGWWHEHEAPGVKYIDRFKIDGRLISNSRELVIDAWSLPAAQADSYSDVAKKVEQECTLGLGKRAVRTDTPIQGKLAGNWFQPR
jgi:hypothetical protein